MTAPMISIFDFPAARNHAAKTLMTGLKRMATIAGMKKALRKELPDRCCLGVSPRKAASFRAFLNVSAPPTQAQGLSNGGLTNAGNASKQRVLGAQVWGGESFLDRERCRNDVGIEMSGPP